MTIVDREGWKDKLTTVLQQRSEIEAKIGPMKIELKKLENRQGTLLLAEQMLKGVLTYHTQRDPGKSSEAYSFLDRWGFAVSVEEFLTPEDREKAGRNISAVTFEQVQKSECPNCKAQLYRGAAMDPRAAVTPSIR